MPNSYTFDQISTILNQITADAQGRTPNISTTPRSVADFVTVAQTALAAGSDPIMHSINQLINKTVFRSRAYKGKFDLLMTDNVTYGNAVRKLTPIFTDSAQTNPMYDDQPADGQSTDQWRIKRPKTLQTIFVGAEQYQVQAPTVFEKQLNNAFRGPDELGQFLAAQTTEVYNDIDQQREALGRGTVSNFIGAKLLSDTASCIHLLTEYNAFTGESYTLQDLAAPEVYSAFWKWALARIAEISDDMTNRSVKWHKALTGYTILRHTPKEFQRMLIYAPVLEQIKNMVLAGTYHDNLLEIVPHEAVSYWQNAAEGQKNKINVVARYTDSDGSVNTGTISQDNIVALLYDREAMGCSIFNDGAATTPMNASGHYWNTFHSGVRRWWNDTTENAVVFLLD